MQIRYCMFCRTIGMAVEKLDAVVPDASLYAVGLETGAFHV